MGPGGGELDPKEAVLALSSGSAKRRKPEKSGHGWRQTLVDPAACPFRAKPSR